MNNKAKIIIIFYDPQAHSDLSYYLQNSRRVLFMCIIFENTLKMILGLLIYLKLVVPDIRLKFTFSNRNQLCQTYLTLLQRDWSWLSREKAA